MADIGRRFMLNQMTEPLTAGELSAKLGIAEAHVRNVLSGMYFKGKDVDPDRPVDVDREGKWFRREDPRASTVVKPSAKIGGKT